MKKGLKVTIAIVLSITIIIGLVLTIVNPIKSLIRRSYSRSAIDKVEALITAESISNETITFQVPKTDALSVDGEDGETDVGIDKLLENMRSLSDEYETLTLLGILEIPCINVKEPIWDTCSTNALRYGVGRYPGTVRIGEAGLCNIFGHRQSGNLDAKLGSIQFLQEYIGEEVIVTTTDGIQHRYKIKKTVYAKDAALMPYLDPKTFKTETLCITACGWGEDPVTHKNYPMNTEFVVICEPK